MVGVDLRGGYSTTLTAATARVAIAHRHGDRAEAAAEVLLDHHPPELARLVDAPAQCVPVEQAGRERNAGRQRREIARLRRLPAPGMAENAAVTTTQQSPALLLDGVAVVELGTMITAPYAALPLFPQSHPRTCNTRSYAIALPTRGRGSADAVLACRVLRLPAGRSILAGIRQP
jgi:hypothetical protein